MKRAAILSGLLALAACGGSGGAVRFSGEIADGCMASGRSSANPALCSCVQGVANRTLSAADRSRASGFFTNPDAAQQTRTRDDSASEAFWLRYRAFADAARSECG